MEDFLEEINNEDIDINIPIEPEELIEEEKPPIYSLLGIEMSFEEFDHLICEQNKGKELVVENGKVVARERIITQEEINLQKILELKNWFEKDYRTYVEMLTRRQALGIDDKIIDEFRNKTYTNLNELYQEAEVVAQEIKDLR